MYFIANNRFICINIIHRNWSLVTLMRRVTACFCCMFAVCDCSLSPLVLSLSLSLSLVLVLVLVLVLLLLLLLLTDMIAADQLLFPMLLDAIASRGFIPQVSIHSSIHPPIH